MSSLGQGLLPVVLTTAALAAMLWPRYGIVARWRAARRLRARHLAEDALKHIHAREWRAASASLESIGGALRVSPRTAVAVATALERDGLIRASEDRLRLTPAGEELALSVIRAHRLWERYLADEARMPLRNIHAEADRREHDRGGDTLSALDAALGYPTVDPHGDPIPTADGHLPAATARPLSDWPMHAPARIAHVEDEPPVIYREIVAQGLQPGMVVRVLEADAQRIVMSDGARVYALSPLVAANVSVVAHETEPAAATLVALSTLAPGRHATVRALADALQGLTRRRLLDLGLTPGVTVTAERTSMFGDPRSYRVRGTLVALRRDQAQHILIDADGRANA